MTQNQILRHSGSHTVEVTEGSKDASRRQTPDRHRLEDTPDRSRHQGNPPGLTEFSAAHPQLIHDGVESIDDWMDDEVFSERLEKLRARNRQMTQSLGRLHPTASGEDTHE